MKKIISTLSICLSLISFTSCEGQKETEFDYNSKSARLIETNNDFGLRLLNSVFENEEAANIMISPTSVSLALGMTYNGAEGTTRDAFAEVFDYGDLDQEEVSEISRELIHVLLTNTRGNLLEIANSIWYREGFPVRQEFIDLNTNYYDALVRELDFADPSALETINDWVSTKTHDKIDKILDQIDPATAMILVNALYFNCLWEVEFDPDDTYSTDFYTEEGNRLKTVEMMTLESDFRVGWSNNYKAIELPYKGNKFSMFLFLPDQGTSVNELASELDGQTWNDWTELFTEQNEYTVELPKFKFEYKRSLKNDLIDMGLEVAFGDGANFSGISEVDLLISDVIHKTYIKLNEEGTEAAAVTAVTMDLTSVGPGKMIRFDRPFLFAITENSSHSILFAGKLGDPTYED